MKRRVLIITYYWPPAGGPGVQRWLKFVKYLPEFDIEPIVYCPENPSYPIVDQSLEAEVSDTITVLKQPIKEPYRFANIIEAQLETDQFGCDSEGIEAKFYSEVITVYPWKLFHSRRSKKLG